MLRLLARCPPGWRAGAARLLGAVWRRAASRRRRIAAANLAYCFPGLSGGELSALLDRHFRSLGFALIEVALAWHADPAALRELVRVDGREHLDAALAGGRGALLLAGHFTTLEIGAARLGIDAPVDGVYRPHADPSMERASRDGRQRFGGRLLDRADVRGMLRRLRANRAVWYAPDQDLGLRYGVFAPFFGRPAATLTATARIARASGAPVLPFRVERAAGGRAYRVVIEPAPRGLSGRRRARRRGAGQRSHRAMGAGVPGAVPLGASPVQDPAARRAGPVWRGRVMRETWRVRKPEVRSSGGVVSTQHYLASEAGARVLADGGNAVDAAVTAGLALGAVEPWMSGLGGCGQMIVLLAGEGRAWSVDFGLAASRDLDPGDYPLDEGRGSDLFHWPAVEGDRNVTGPLSIAVPTYAAGVAAALERSAPARGADCIAPAVELAERGFDADWYATLKIASTAARLAADDECRRVYLPDGFPPCSEWGGPPPRLRLGRLAETLRRLAAAGPRDFYEGAIARSLVADAERLGARLGPEDLAGVQARIRESLAIPYGRATVHAAPGLTGGPSLARALALLVERRAAAGAARPETEADLAVAYADALSAAYAERLAAIGHDAEAARPACTTHLSVVDRAGNLVALTQTLLSLFGSRVMFPATGVLMNNGVMWFDPHPGRPNSIAAGRRPLANMCPVVVERGGGDRFALGASEGAGSCPR